MNITGLKLYICYKHECDVYRNAQTSGCHPKDLLRSFCLKGGLLLVGVALIVTSASTIDLSFNRKVDSCVHDVHLPSPWKRGLAQKLTDPQLVMISPRFMELENLLLQTQKPEICTYPEPGRSSSGLPILTL